MPINPNQISVAKIYPGNYVNVLRYWHEIRDVDQQPPSTNGPIMRDQPVGGPVGDAHSCRMAQAPRCQQHCRLDCRGSENPQHECNSTGTNRLT